MSDLPAPNAKYLALIQLLRTAEDLWNASRVFFAPWNLSPSQFNVLNLLYGQPEGLSQSELSRLLIMHRSNATGLIDRLEKRGLVQRAPHPTDRRAYRLLLTAKGVTLLHSVYPHYYQAADAVWAGVPDTQSERFLVQLRQLAENALKVADQSVSDEARTLGGPAAVGSQKPPSDGLTPVPEATRSPDETDSSPGPTPRPRSRVRPAPESPRVSVQAESEEPSLRTTDL